MKSFKNHIEEAHSEWHVTFKTGHKPQRVKGRNTAEAIKKAEKRARNSGEKDSRQLAMYKDIKKVSEDVEVDEAMSLRDIKNKKEREEKRKKEYGDETQHQRMKRKVYGNMMGGLKKEEVEQVDEVLDTPKAMQSYKNKAKASKEKAAGSAAAKILRGKDKDGNRADHSSELKTMAKREKGMKMADKNAIKKTFKKLRGEETELDEAKTGMFGGKYTSKDHMLGMKNFSKIRDKRAAQRNAEHQKQDPKMAKMGYAKHMLDTDKADAKARKRGIDPTGKYDKYKKKNGIREEVELTESDIAEILRQYALSENVNADQLAALSEEEINEIIGKVLGTAFKVGAKTAVGAGRLAKKGAKAASSQGRIEREKKKLAREKQKMAKAKASRSMFSKQGRENRAKDRAELQKIRDQRRDLAAKRKSGNFS